MTALMPEVRHRSTLRRHRVMRRRLDGATDDRLFFAQVREDPTLELAALGSLPGGTYVVVGSGGCTALSLLAAGAERVIAVDLNSTQNHVTELKAAAVASLDPADCTAFLGGAPMREARRARIYATLKPSLSQAAARYWDTNLRGVTRGIIQSGVSERFIGSLSRLVRATIHPSSRIERFLSCSSLDEQVAYYHEHWNSRRWKLLFKALLNRWTLNRTYDPGFFSHVENDSFSAHFHGVFERTVTLNPISENYFLHQMLTGYYPKGSDTALPPYLSPTDSNRLFSSGIDGLEIVDGSFQDYLWLCENDSVDGIVLSNICEWLSQGEVDRLFASVARVARPGAGVCFRNFVGHTEVPDSISSVIVEDRAAGIAAISRDRSSVQSRFAKCRVEKPA